MEEGEKEGKEEGNEPNQCKAVGFETGNDSCQETGEKRIDHRYDDGCEEPDEDIERECQELLGPGNRGKTITNGMKRG